MCSLSATFEVSDGSSILFMTVYQIKITKRQYSSNIEIQFPNKGHTRYNQQYP
jgi:hypothetical protein